MSEEYSFYIVFFGFLKLLHNKSFLENTVIQRLTWLCTELELVDIMSSYRDMSSQTVIILFSSFWYEALARKQIILRKYNIGIYMFNGEHKI